MHRVGVELTPREYTEEVRGCSKSWRELDQSAKDAFEAKARHEQYTRQEAASQPLKSKYDRVGPSFGDASFDAAAELGTKALRKIRLPRLVSTYREFSQTDLWATAGLGLASADGCLSLDRIDLVSTDKEVVAKMRAALHEPATSSVDLDAEDHVGLHHQTCFQVFGHCRELPHGEVARKYVMNFEQFLSDGIWDLKGSEASAWLVLVLAFDI